MTELHSKATSAPDPPLSRLTSAVQGVVGDSGVEGLLPAQFAELADDHGDPVGFEDGRGQQSDGAGASDQRDIAGFGPAANEGVITHGQRFDQRCFVEGDVADRVHPTPFHDDLLAQASTPAGEADVVHVRRQVVVRSGFGRFLRVDDVGLDDDVVADLEIGDVLTDGVDGAGHFVAEGDRCRFTGDRVRMAGRWHEDGAVQVLVQVGAADAAPGDIDTDRSGLDHGFIDILDADIAAIEIACCLHDFSPDCCW